MKKNFKELEAIEKLELVLDILKRMGIDTTDVTVKQALQLYSDIKDAIMCEIL